MFRTRFSNLQFHSPTPTQTLKNPNTELECSALDSHFDKQLPIRAFCSVTKSTVCKLWTLVGVLYSIQVHICAKWQVIAVSDFPHKILKSPIPLSNSNSTLQLKTEDRNIPLSNSTLHTPTQNGRSEHSTLQLQLYSPTQTWKKRAWVDIPYGGMV